MTRPARAETDRLAGRSILVTGASTGIGAACARRFDRAGATVFAGVRSLADATRLGDGASHRLTPVLLDITDPGQVAEAFARITAEVGERGLDGLVNNAGVAHAGPIELLELDAWRSQFEVNLFGQLTVTRAAIEPLRTAGGRVVFVGSIAGRVATPLIGPYAASKHALAAVAECLGHELRPWGIRVSLIEPGAVTTPIWDKGRDTATDLDRTLGEDRFAAYREAVLRLRRTIDQSAAKGCPPDRVAARIEHVITTASPRTRYLVGSDAIVAGWADRLLPDAVMAALIRRM